MKRKTLLSKTLLLLGLMLAGAGSAWADKYVKVTDVNSLAVGDKVIFVSPNSDKSLNIAGKIASSVMERVQVNISDGELTSLPEGVDVLTLGKNGTYWTFISTLGNGELIGATAAKKVAYGKGTTTWTISFSDGKATVANTETTYGKFLYNVQSPRFTTYTSNPAANMLLIELWKFEGDSGSGTTKEVCGLEYEETEFSVAINGSFTAPTLTNPNNLAVSYESDNEEVATVAEDGSVTIKGVVGKAKITASFAGDDNYYAGSASYTINVYDPDILTVTFNFSEDYGQTYMSGNTAGYEDDPFEYTKGDISLYVEGRYRFWDNDKTLRLYAANDDYDAAALMLTAPARYEITSVVANVALTNLTPDYGTISGSEWTGSENSILFTATATTNIKTLTVTYKEITTLTATVTSAGWATYAPKYAVEFREGTEAYIIDLADTEEAVLTKVTSVPAGTAVLLKGEGEHTMDVVASSTTDVSDNCLKVSDGKAKDDIYVLANGNYGVGFYRWIGESALSAGKIYLEPNMAGSRTFIRLPGADTTGISASLNEKGEMRKEKCFDLQGRRMAQPAKGLYIVNGKKFINK